MNYKGTYDGSVNYAVGDVAVYTDGIPYVMHKDAPAGVPCHNVLYWERVPQPLADTVVMFHSMITSMNAAISGATEGALIAPEYTKTTYTNGDLRRHNGKLYKAKQNIGTAENWTASHWEETTVGAEIAASNGSIATNAGNITEIQGVVFDDKTLVLGSSTESSTKKWAITVDDSDGIQVDEITE